MIKNIDAVINKANARINEVSQLNLSFQIKITQPNANHKFTYAIEGGKKKNKSKIANHNKIYINLLI